MIVPIMKRNRYSTTNDRIEIFVFSVMIFPFNLIKDIDLDGLVLMKTFLIFFKTMRCLAILMPPLVDPVLPPENIKRKIKSIAGKGHRYIIGRRESRACQY